MHSAPAESAIAQTLMDAEGRVAPEFHIPAALKPSVEFWLRVYTELSTEQVILFDSEHPEIVYDVLDFRTLSVSARNRAAYEIVSEKRISHSLSQIRNALLRLDGRKNSSRLSALERNIQTAVQVSTHKHRFKELARSLRAQRGQRDNLMRGLYAAQPFLPKMEQIFVKMGIPSELTRLSLLESSFNLEAVSRVGAVGVWQFMLASGKEYMKIENNFRLDERLSPLKSTVAAAKLLRRNLKILGSWPLAITSYNHGIRQLKNAKNFEPSSEKLVRVFSPCKNKYRLGWASRNYYPGFLAIVHAAAYRQLFFPELPEPLSRPIHFKEADGKQNALNVAAANGISIFEFQALNPDVRDLKMRLPKHYWIALPSSQDDWAGLVERARRSKRRT